MEWVTSPALVTLLVTPGNPQAKANLNFDLNRTQGDKRGEVRGRDT